jgi:hypothetical protein
MFIEAPLADGLLGVLVPDKVGIGQIGIDRLVNP